MLPASWFGQASDSITAGKRDHANIGLNRKNGDAIKEMCEDSSMLSDFFFLLGSSAFSVCHKAGVLRVSRNTLGAEADGILLGVGNLTFVFGKEAVILLHSILIAVHIEYSETLHWNGVETLKQNISDIILSSILPWRIRKPY